MPDRRPLLVVRHVSWEGPHRILEAFGDVPVRLVDTLSSDDPLPLPSEVCGAVFMGGPMSANDTERHPRLSEELRWLEQAVAAEVPVLGVCLGSQLLAPLAPAASVLHWHGEAFELPAGASALARSTATELQAFRAGPCAWGLLFHAEADSELLERWLEEPAMAREACDHLGPDYERRLRDGAAGVDRALTQRVFAAFARRCAAR